MGLVRSYSRARLAARVIRRLRRSGVADARYDARAFAVRFTPPGADAPVVAPLQGLRREQIAQFVAGFVGSAVLPGDWSTVRPMLRPVLRGGIPATGISAPLRRAAWPFLSEFVVVDQPDAMTYVSAEQPAGWGVPPDEVFDTARANLSGAVLRGVATEPTVVRFVDDGDAYWTSHLLLDGWLAGLAEQVGGVPVAFAPERGTLLVTADLSAHLPKLFAQAEMVYLTSPRPITPMAYRPDGQGRTVPYAAPPGHPIHDCVLRARSVQAMQEYARQAAVLDDAAPLELADGGRTRTTWSDTALLPRADEIVKDDQVHPWSELEPRLRRQDGLEPPRWRAV